ncbi:hypothetical protein ACFOPQ_05685 [Deinococcus antarcticus]|uniref:Uncharacterized protein n=1 Tax=Deinococcus antarcticus TaxID=1298767 RepID=A0ABV8A484_9DEIO
MPQLRLVALSVLGSFSLASAQTLPGQNTTPAAVGVPNLLLRTDERDKLVFINNVKVTRVEAFTSQAGRKHLRFQMNVGGTSYAGVMFDGDWKSSDQVNLQKGNAHLLGFWGKFNDKPSFSAMRVFTSPIKPNANAPKTEKTLMIRDAQILVPTVAQFTSSSKKVHLTYSFVVNSKTYQAVVYDGDWTPETARQLKTGRATLYGNWAEYNGKPSFVTEKVGK